ncbi:REP-associated tyrosine transposase [Pseudotabrizicola algicola]|uniref:Transposase n=1 Tax=Pseudotabrizicola algicola TaxID=2709381 RepID=A0A6B3RNZ1_9RHOB|nr:transposase [Pseudotabrizicola algicola]NEX47844.1 transposase [Pseudotabrizicola algicola]
MPEYRRPDLTDMPIYFTVALADRGSDALLRNIGLLRQAVRQTRAERPFDILAWVVLPDHMHCIWSLPEGDRDYPTRWRLIKSRVSRALPCGPRRASDMARHERGFWQRRYWEHHLRDAPDLSAHLRQCWLDPVRHGLVSRPEDWPWSSQARAHRRAGAARAEAG